MSTKTSIKRIALVAVAGLGLGLMSTVAANAAAVNPSYSTTVTTTPVATTISTPAPAGSTIIADLKVTPALAAATEAITYSPVFKLVDPNGTDVTSSATFSTNATQDTGLTVSNSTATYTVTQGTTATAAVHTIGTVSFTPAMGGVYVLSVTQAAATSTSNTSAAIPAGTAVGSIYVSGAGAVVASGGVGTSTVSAVTGGIAKVLFGTAAHTSGQVYNLTTSGVGVIQSGVAGTGTPTVAGIAGATDYSQGAKVTTSANTDFNDMTATVASTVAGVQTLTWTSISTTTGAPTTVATATITWGAAATASTVSTAFINSGDTYAASNAATGVYVSKGASTTAVAANIGVTLKDSNGSPLVGQKLTVSISGPGAFVVMPKSGALVAGTTTVGATVAGIRAYTDATANTSYTWMIGIAADGTAGTSTVTISVGTTVVATKTLYFYGPAAKIAVTQKYSIAKASSAGAQLGVSTSNTSATSGYVPAIKAEVTDANGNDIAATLTCLIADLTVISSCVILPDDNADYGSGTGFYNISVVSAPGGISGKSTTVTVRTLLSSGAYVSSDPITFTLGGSIATTSVTLDSATYTPGQPMQLTISAKDSAGNPTYDGQSIAYSITANKPVGGSLPATSKVFALGKYATSLTTPTLFAPSVDGDFTVTVLGNDLANTAVTATATVSNAASQDAIDAANEATDAANAATDAANAAAEAADAATAAAQDAQAAVAALATQVSSLIAGIKAQITSLTNLVIKIQKKVKA